MELADYEAMGGHLAAMQPFDALEPLFGGAEGRVQGAQGMKRKMHSTRTRRK